MYLGTLETAAAIFYPLSGVCTIHPLDVAQEFPAPVRERGERYFRDGRVQLLAMDNRGLEAEVRGSDLYEVRVGAGRDGRLEYECDCPFGLDVGVCKHVWATLRAADTAAWSPISARGSTTSAAKASTPWSSQLRALSASMSRDPLTAAHPGFPANKRVVYILDFYETSMRTDGLLIEVRLESRLKTGEWGEPQELRLPREAWLAAPDAVDREIAQMLLGAQHAWG